MDQIQVGDTVYYTEEYLDAVDGQDDYGVKFLVIHISPSTWTDEMLYCTLDGAADNRSNTVKESEIERA